METDGSLCKPSLQAVLVLNKALRYLDEQETPHLVKSKE